MNMGRITTGRTLKKVATVSDTTVKKRKLAHSSTGSSPGVVFTAVSFASPEKSDKGDLEVTNSVFVGNDGETSTHGHQVHTMDGSGQEIDVTTRTLTSSRGGSITCTPPTSMFIPHSPHQHQDEITSQSNHLALSDNDGLNCRSKDHESPSRHQSLRPRNGARGHHGGIDMEPVPSLCSSTSGMQSESSPESARNYENSDNKEIDNRSLGMDSGDRLPSNINSSAMEIPITSPKPMRDEMKSCFRADRNVTFSPVPPVKYHYFDESHGRSYNKVSTESAKGSSSVMGKLMTAGLSFPASTGIKTEESQMPYKIDLDGDNHEEHKEKIRDGGITPTNFAFDYGKIELTSSFDGANALSWLQTPTGNMFSPGGLAVSTPLLNVLFFPEGPSHPFSPRHAIPGDSRISKAEPVKLENASVHAFNSVICVSPLASSKSTAAQSHKAQNSLNSINFKEVFASPKIYQESMSTDAKNNRSNAATDAAQQKANIDLDFHIAERDIMEDEDLNLLRNLAQSTPKELSLEERTSHPSMKYGGKASVFRGSPRSGDKVLSWKHPPSSLQMPLIHSESNSRGPVKATMKYPPEMLKAHSKKSAQSSSRKGKKHVLPTNSITNTNVVESRVAPNQHGSTPGKPSAVPAAAGYYPPGYAHYHHPHHMGMPPPPYRYPYPHPHHPYGIFPNQVPTSMTPRGTLINEARATKSNIKRSAIERMNVNKPGKKLTPKTSTNTNTPVTKKVKTASSQGNITERPKPAAVLSSIDSENSTKLDKAAALAAAIMRGVTMRPSGKWQAQLYYAGKSRYIGVFDTREKAALAYEIAREQLKTDRPIEPGSISMKETEANVNAARQAAFDGVNEADSKLGGVC